MWLCNEDYLGQKGLEKIHFLTRKGPCRLRVDLWDFDDDFAFAEYR